MSSDEESFCFGRRARKNVLTDCEEENSGDENGAKENDSRLATVGKRKSWIIDDKDGEESTVGNPPGQGVLKKHDSSDEERESPNRIEEDSDSSAKGKKQPIRKNSILDDESSDEERDLLNVDSVKENRKTKAAKKNTVLDEVSSNDKDFSAVNRSEEDRVSNNEKQEVAKKKSILDSDIYDSEGSSDEETYLSKKNVNEESPKDKKTKTKNKSLLNSDVYDAEGSSDEEKVPNRELSDPERSEESAKEDKGKKTKGRKKSVGNKKMAKSEVDEIHAEAQRLVRVSNVSLPYHTPKQRSLDDFLNRRKSNPPVVPLRTSADHFKKVWEHIEKREIEAETFYRSESEESEKGIDGEKTKDESTVKRVTFDVEKAEKNISGDGEDNEVIGCEEKTGMAEESVRNKTSVELVSAAEDDETNKVGNVGLAEGSRVENVHEDVDVDGLADREIGGRTSCDRENNLSHEKPKDREESPGDATLMDIQMNITPKIVADTPDGVIDLDEDSARPGTLGLIKRFMKHTAIHPKKIADRESVSLSVVSTEYDATSGEIVKLSEETIQVAGHVQPRPGEKLASLKAKLRQSMAVTRKRQLAHRVQEFKLNESELYGDDPLEDEFEFPETEKKKCGYEDEAEADEEEDGEEEVEEEVEEDIEDSKEGKKAKGHLSNFLDDEAEVSEREDGSGDEDYNFINGRNNSEEDENDDEDDAKNSSEDEEDCTENSSAPYTFEPLSQEAPENCSFFKSAREEVMTFQSSDEFFSTPNDNELMALCSGKFSSQPLKLTDLETSDKFNTDTEEMNLVFPDETEDNIRQMNNSAKSLLESSDDEDVVVKKAKKKTKKKLNFSDDEDVDDTVNDKGESEKDEASETENGDGGLLGSGDEQDEVGESISGEIKRDWNEEEEAEAINPAGFFDQEAELSGSDWGSADEDEHDLDILDTEEADAENINQRRLKHELDRIHMKELMDDDNREIRILKELFLEDGELHSDGPKRQRMFRWSNPQGDDSQMKPSVFDSAEDYKDAEEEEEEEVWRKTRHERETFLQKNRPKESDDDLDSDLLRMAAKRRQTPKTAVAKVQKDILSSPDPKHPFKLITKRGSFLGRSDKVLTRLAEMTSRQQEGDANVGKSRGKRNMVFAVISPPKNEKPDIQGEENTSKRKASEGTATTASVSKRPKLSGRGDADRCLSLLEKLRYADINVK